MSAQPPATAKANQLRPGNAGSECLPSRPSRRGTATAGAKMFPVVDPPALAAAAWRRHGRKCPGRPPNPWEGERFLGGVRARGRAPSTGLCATGTMAEFRALSLAKQRLHLEAQPQQVGRVDRVALVERTLLGTVQH